MPKIVSVGTAVPKFALNQETVVEFARELFSHSYSDIERLLSIFSNGNISKRHFVKGLDWFKENHSFEEKNDVYIQEAISYGVRAINNCLNNESMLHEAIHLDEIDAIFYISSTGISTPSIEARIMNKLSFSEHVKRIPIWGLGCAGGAAGLTRAFEYCKAFPEHKVLVLTVELCSLTFQRQDPSKSNLVGTSLFADGIACACIVGDLVEFNNKITCPSIIDTLSTLMKDSEEVMGWDIKNDGLYVVFSRDIPTIIRTWLHTNVQKFLLKHNLSTNEIDQCIFHPGGKKVLDAYEKSLQLSKDKLKSSQTILNLYGNMSSATIFYVLKEVMEKEAQKGDTGLAVALGPGFCSEQVLLKWED
ncbi:type III polyketide synthase [Sutcliffiella cohnii]|uniref:Type III polyketide synthase n=1 Tax=Sutcliffiella cohnii TaxID=33932 RepID=A0A223KQ50_9BACI|nr:MULTISPECIES: 3-oxoacyl-[acyl-carrier-protein] synthase III C-terminal domain-containing protein [Sutcliffiella]AST91645.1 type III polyketide synthase [Sutcliffiella cohnii]MED4014768.1 3-oxoacyl-[acyl-carrier-protein] synthase III C-terminal domain-containing protein [Sutcliffiella cohnii]WBL12863.1 type III polyketide synthase [Sutcliffiella sp. NC1]